MAACTEPFSPIVISWSPWISPFTLPSMRSDSPQRSSPVTEIEAPR